MVSIIKPYSGFCASVFGGGVIVKEQNGVRLQCCGAASASHSFIRLECLPLGFCKVVLSLFVFKGVESEI